MKVAIQRQRAERFQALHRESPLLLLPNAWDAVSAKIYELEGFQAIGTTSAGIANAHGYADGEKAPLERQLAVIGRISSVVSVPVSADIEAGYAPDAKGVAGTIARAIEAGAVGVNLEDGPHSSAASHEHRLYAIEEQIDRIAAARAAIEGSGIPIVLNARTDAFLMPGQRAERLRSAVGRGNAYRRAGADCIFVPDVGDLDEDSIELLAREIDAPLNLIARSTLPPVARLEELGVARLSFGPRPMRALLSLLREMAREWKEQGTYEKLTDSGVTYDEINGWFET